MAPLARAWKYAVLGLTSIVFEETNPILGGIAARHGRAQLLAVIAAVAIGIWLASLALYWIGYSRINWVRRRWPDKEEPIETALRLVARHPWRASLAIRFAYGLRLPLPIACGAARVPLSLYGIASGISCLLWSIAFAYVGLAFGGAALRVLQVTRRLEVRLGLLALLLLIVLLFITRRRMAAPRESPGGEPS